MDAEEGQELEAEDGFFQVGELRGGTRGRRGARSVGDRYAVDLFGGDLRTVAGRGQGGIGRGRRGTGGGSGRGRGNRLFHLDNCGLYIH